MSSQLSPHQSELETDERVAGYDRWYRAKVLDTMNSTKPRLTHDEAVKTFGVMLAEYRACRTNLLT